MNGTDLIDLTNALAAIRNGPAESVTAAVETVARLEARYCFGDASVLNDFDWAAAFSADSPGSR